MLGRTHLVLGVLIFLVLDRFLSVRNSVVLLIIILFASLFPDIDEKHSFLGRRLKLFSLFGHRQIFHSVYFLILFSLLIYFVFNNFVYALGFLVAFAGHLFLDTLTRQGVKPFLFGIRFKGGFRTGGIAENVVFLAGLASGIFIVFF